MKYTAPYAEVVALETVSVVLTSTTEETTTVVTDCELDCTWESDMF